MFYKPKAGKICRKCSQWKPYPELCRKPHCTEGFDSLCKQCMHKRAREWVRQHPERRKEISHKHYSRHRESRAAYSRWWRQLNRARHNASKLRHYYRNRAKHSENHRRWVKLHPEKSRQYHHIRRTRESASDRHFTAEDVKAQYKRQRGKCYYCHTKLGASYHVDHIVPLSGKIVSGLHVPWNLRAIPAQENNRRPRIWDPNTVI